MEYDLKIGCYVLAIVLLGALTLRAAHAEDSASGTQAGAQATPSVSEDVTSGSGGKTGPDDIDTRITVVPHRTTNKVDKAAEFKIKSNAAVVKNPHRRTFLASRTPNRIVRNAANVSIVQPEGRERSESGHVAPTSGLGLAGHTDGPIAEFETMNARPPVLSSGTNRIAAPTALNRGLSGTGMTHRGTSPSGLGGPAKTVAGISGTAIRPTH
jgi:hypothetical protein